MRHLGGMGGVGRHDMGALAPATKKRYLCSKTRQSHDFHDFWDSWQCHRPPKPLLLLTLFSGQSLKITQEKVQSIFDNTILGNLRSSRTQHFEKGTDEIFVRSVVSGPGNLAYGSNMIQET